MEVCLECSAKDHFNIDELVTYGEKLAAFPISPLLNRTTNVRPAFFFHLAIDAEVHPDVFLRVPSVQQIAQSLPERRRAVLIQRLSFVAPLF